MIRFGLPFTFFSINKMKFEFNFLFALVNFLIYLGVFFIIMYLGETIRKNIKDPKTGKNEG